MDDINEKLQTAGNLLFVEQYYDNHLELRLDKGKLYRQILNYRAVEKYKQSNKDYRKKQRLKLLSVLGNKCMCSGCKWHHGECDIDLFEIIDIHHKDHDGKEDRRRIKGIRFIKYYIEHPQEARKRLQNLCANCHRIVTSNQYMTKERVHIREREI